MLHRWMIAAWWVVFGLVATLVPAGAAEAAEIEVKLVRASRGEPMLDPRLQEMARDLRSLPYTRFEQLGEAAVDGLGKVTASLPHDVVATVRIKAEQPGQYELDVSLVRAGSLLTTTTLTRPVGSAGVLSVGREGDAAWVVTVRVLR